MKNCRFKWEPCKLFLLHQLTTNLYFMSKKKTNLYLRDKMVKMFLFTKTKWLNLFIQKINKFIKLADQIENKCCLLKLIHFIRNWFIPKIVNSICSINMRTLYNLLALVKRKSVSLMGTIHQNSRVHVLHTLFKHGQNSKEEKDRTWPEMWSVIRYLLDFFF